jgi:hypothetical protein
MAAIFADVLESTREPGTSRFSASGVAHILGLQQQDLAELAGSIATPCAPILNRQDCSPHCVT